MAYTTGMIVIVNDCYGNWIGEYQDISEVAASVALLDARKLKHDIYEKDACTADLATIGPMGDTVSMPVSKVVIVEVSEILAVSDVALKAFQALPSWTDPTTPESHKNA